MTNSGFRSAPKALFQAGMQSFTGLRQPRHSIDKFLYYIEIKASA
jgi:hypothetical protein